MTIAEPATTITDLVLAALGIGFGVRLLARTPSLTAPRGLWGAGLLATALAALAGAAYHGLAPGLTVDTRASLWLLTYVALGLADVLLTAGLARSLMASGAHGTLLAVLLLRYALYVSALVSRRDFGTVVVEFAGTLVLLAALGVWLAARGEAAGRLVLAGVAVSFVGGLVQKAKIAPHPEFNHNDLFHCVQMVGLWLFYRAGLVFPAAAEPELATPEVAP